MLTTKQIFKSKERVIRGQIQEVIKKFSGIDVKVKINLDECSLISDGARNIVEIGQIKIVNEKNFIYTQLGLINSGLHKIN